ncbi:MAG: hypothetical protein CR984_03780 [Proteobacteria bacterium]|nr:MAG: hypothetical protein CR984_03780 [Pseudomonadota bacterium]PIE67456.1 MAG: hypothetical protein CSA23_04210 [Deltaproteobacteria bacterium]
MKLLRLILSMALVFFVSSTAYSATYTITLDLPSDPTEIESIFFVFDVEADFNYINDSLALGDAAPQNDRTGDSQYQWELSNSNPAPIEGMFLLDAFNSDVLDTSVTIINVPGLGNIQTSDGLYNENNLVNGTLFTFEYEGTLKLEKFSAFNSLAGPVSYDSLLRAIKTEEGLTVTTTPIPPALLLLGSGLAGGIGLRRRMIR